MSYVSFARNTQGETTRVGGLFFGRTVKHGPRRAFALKKLKLNTKSPRGGGGLFFGAVHPLLPRLASRAKKIFVPRGLIFSAEIKRNQTTERGWGVGGLKSGRRLCRKPRAPHPGIFFLSEFFQRFFGRHCVRFGFLGFEIPQLPRSTPSKRGRPTGRGRKTKVWRAIYFLPAAVHR